ncbi:MAG: aldose 1-epimerase [Alphaproteobacteria bacterium]
MSDYEVITLTDGHVTVRLTPQAGAIIDAYYHKIPFMRPQPEKNKKNFDVLNMAGFALIPFGNRLKGNKFVFNGNRYQFKANTVTDPYYLHGDAWLADWAVTGKYQNEVSLQYSCEENQTTPYRYLTKQKILLQNNKLIIHLSVTNKAADPMPFGLGYHPYFPRTTETKLRAKSQYMYNEKKDFLSGEIMAKTKALDFYDAQPLPKRWVNNSFAGWNGAAQIIWPENGLQLDMTAYPSFKYYHLFVPNKQFDTNYNDDYFCFEPSTHAANAHHRLNFAGLKILEHGETLAGIMIFKPKLILN